MMNAVGSDGQRKHIMYVDRLSMMYRDRKLVVSAIRRHNSIQHAVNLLSQYRNIGQFVAYEFATDLTYTSILSRADDLYTWANPGPGASRGLCRLLGRPVKLNMKAEEAVPYMQTLLSCISRDVPASFWGRRLTMRDIEHSLCEFDKYERVRLGEGRPRAKFRKGKGKEK